MATTPPDLADFISAAERDALIQLAKLEDLGPDGLDITCQVMLSGRATGSAVMVTRASGRTAGLALLEAIASAFDMKIQVELAATDGEAVEAGTVLARLNGPLRSLLSMERVALNFVSHLSGIASITARYVARTAGTAAEIYDTRKTLPGLRCLQKYAVACGGGRTHRLGLYDAMLVKDNHLAGVGLDQLAKAVREGIAAARAMKPTLKFVEVEVDTLDQLKAVLTVKPDIILLDNMTDQQMREAVALRDREAPNVALEASGGVTLDRVQAVAATGVDRISVGALTHSAAALDIGLDIR